MAIVTVMLAIGASTAVFSLVNALLIRPLPYQAPQNLVLLFEKFPAQGLEQIPVSAPEYLDYVKELGTYERIAAFNFADFNLTGGDLPERIQGAVVTPSLFPLLGVQPIKGRVFKETEFGEGNDDVILISERLWRRRFNSEPQLVGTQVSINGNRYTVIGIMPASFEFPLPLFGVQGGTFAERADIWKPIAFTKNELESRGSRSYGVIGRLKPGVALAQAQAELNTVVTGWYPLFPDNYGPVTNFGAALYPLQNLVVGNMRGALMILIGAVGVVLLIACANLTTMLLARAGAREREFAIRLALGAGRTQLLRQMLSESLVLSLVGALAGVLVAVWGLDLLRSIGTQTVPRLAEVNIDLRVLFVSLIVAIGTGIVFGLIPALATGKPELTEALKEGGRGATIGIRRNRLRNALVVTEFALALVLLVGASLLLKSFVRLQNVDPGFSSKNVLTMEVALPVAKYPRGKPVVDLFAEALRGVQALPGVEVAALTSILPLSGTNSDSSFAIQGREMVQGKPSPDEEIRTITPQYFQVLKIPLQRGRPFSESDNTEAPNVTIINQALAKKWFPETDPIGKQITFNDPRKPDAKWISIVGVVGDVRHRSLDEEAKPEFYIPHTQRAQRQMILTIRSQQDPRSLTSAIRAEIRKLDPDLPVANVRMMDQVAADSIAPRRLSVVLIGLFAIVALALASIGIYGVMSFLVVQRTHEIGVRMALGAQRRDVFMLVMGRAARLLILGGAIGLILAFFSSRTLGSLLYNVPAFDLPTFTFVTFVLALVALLASYIPARRATRADPMLALGQG
ncbi:MAG: ABC transporter permease [Verrucomicrobiota bacterium]|nr:ABC transporter permease [Verrucomicrobiota bacterium]